MHRGTFAWTLMIRPSAAPIQSELTQHEQSTDENTNIPICRLRKRIYLLSLMTARCGDSNTSLSVDSPAPVMQMWWLMTTVGKIHAGFHFSSVSMSFRLSSFLTRSASM